MYSCLWALSPQTSPMPYSTPEPGSSLPEDCAWVSLSSGTMGGEVWRPALNQISRNIRKTALGWGGEQGWEEVASQAGDRRAYSWPGSPRPGPAPHSPTYLASWMRAMTSQRPTSPHTLAAPISMNTSTHSSTLSHVSSFCWDSDCKNPRPRGQGAAQFQALPLGGTELRFSPC